MKFNGRYILFSPKDRLYVTLKLPDGSSEFYSSTLPLTSVHNLVIGKLYVDVHGKSQVVNHTSQELCEVEWRERGWTGKNANLFQGLVKTASGKSMFKVQGRFSENISIVNLESGEENEVWKIDPKPDQAENMYNFSTFALQLNYLPESLAAKLPPTDSRFRPD